MNSATSNDNNSATTGQHNSANVANNLTLGSNSGNNNASFNVGDSSITTQDANTTGTVITSLNTNVDGVAVATFDVADNHIGDIILAPGNATSSCTNGCGATNNTSNTANGANSTNNASNNSTNNSITDQSNNAVIGSTLDLTANSGDNQSSFNTGGDSSITTGDANVSANVLTMANNNIAGNVLYNVVNIYGNLVGDIILPQSTIDSLLCNTCGGSSTSNNKNGDNSTNTASNNTTNNSTTNQSNNAQIDNNININGTTGNNDSSYNTGGNSDIQTGASNVVANVLNVANTNIDGGTWWLVIVNQAGKWIGKIVGSPDGANMAGSAGTEFEVDPITGEVTAVGANTSNSGNGDNTTNTASNNTTNNSTTTQSNDAKIQNNLNLTANTGGNATNFNTGGNSNIIYRRWFKYWSKTAYIF
jgi:hypothetical protein